MATRREKRLYGKVRTQIFMYATAAANFRNVVIIFGEISMQQEMGF
jgi:hypothetical protein